MNLRSTVSIMAILWPAALMPFLVKALPATPTTITSSAENEISSPGTEKNNHVMITPLSGDFSKVAGVLATIANSIEDQIRIPQTMFAEEALVRMQQVRPLIDEAFHRLAQDLEKWSRNHPAESRQLFTLLLPAVGLVVLTVTVMSAAVLAVGYVFSTTGLTSVAGLLTGVLAGRSLPFSGADVLQVNPEELYNVSFWQGINKFADNPAVLKTVFEAIDKFNEMHDGQHVQVASHSHQSQQE